MHYSPAIERTLGEILIESPYLLPEKLSAIRHCSSKDDEQIKEPNWDNGEENFFPTGSFKILLCKYILAMNSCIKCRVTSLSATGAERVASYKSELTKK